MDVTLIPGTGVGPHVVDVVRAATQKLGAPITWDEQNEIEAAIASIQRTRLALKGKWLATPKKGVLPPSIRFRKALGVHTIIRHVRTIPGLPARAANVDIVIVREGSEDIYSGFEHESTDGVFESVKVTTRAACERVHRFAFDLASRLGRKKVTTVHKANIMKKADGMFLRVGQAIASEWPAIEHGDVIVDALCMNLVRRPHQFDVLVCGNLFGDIVSDCAAGMAGGITVATGINYGPDLAVFENPHGGTLDGIGVENANPYPMLKLTSDLLRHVGEVDRSTRLMGAIERALQAGLHTTDMGGRSTLGEVSAAILAEI